MALLERMQELDILEPVMDLISDTGPFRIFEGDKIRQILPASFMWDGPWVNVKVCPYRNCYLWMGVYFKHYRVIYRKCFNCWKVVIKPKTLKDLMALLSIQTKMDLPSKCGIERRDYARNTGNYSGFFYTPLTGNPDDGKKLLEKVRVEVYKKLPIDTPVFLKRGCTEMENGVGPSDKWIYPPPQQGFEAMLDAVWDVPPIVYPSPSLIIPLMFKKWIGYAFANQDKTASDYYDSIRSFGLTETVKYGTAANIKPVSLPPLELNDEIRDTRIEGEEVLVQGLPED